MNSFENPIQLAPQQETKKVYLSNGKKRQLMKERFDKNEGEYKNFEGEEINSFKKVRQNLTEIASKECPEHSFEEKMKLLKKLLLDLAKKINNEISISQEQIDMYVDKKKRMLTDNYYKLHSAAELIDYLDNNSIFEYKIRTSGLDKVSCTPQEELSKIENIAYYLNNLFGQSIYYVTPSGMTLRLKLSEIKRPRSKTEDILQPPMEQIFYNEKPVDYDDNNGTARKKVVKISDLTPEKGKHVFEISSPQFKNLIESQGEIEEGVVKSGVGVIQNNEGHYINIPEESIVHAGWCIVGVEKLNKSSEKEK